MISRLPLVILALIPILAAVPVLAQTPERIVPKSAGELQLSYSPVVKKVAPAVVNIYTKRQVTVRNISPFFNDPFFSMFFRDDFFGGHMKQRVESSLGSGVIISESGEVITNAHVIKSAQEIKVVLADGREFSATLALEDKASDLAVLQIDTQGQTLPYAKLKPSETLEVGDIVLAIGNPFGVGQTVTSGIISAQGRSSLDINDFNFFIQTDAAINPGNSGGALVSLDGGVVGINTAIFSRSGGSLGIGFAIPSEMVASVLAAKETGRGGNRGIVRPWLGVTGQTVTADIAESLGLEIPRGVLIAALHSHSPLQKAGIRTGDVVIAMDGKNIRDPSEMKFRMATVPLGGKANIRILRAGKTLDFKIDAVAPPEFPARDETKIGGQSPLNGATIANINPALASELNIDTEEGVIITAITANSYTARVARIGDMILQVNGRPVKTVKEAQAALSRPAANGTWDIIVSTNGQSRRILLR